jgi:hypothetical protein
VTYDPNRPASREPFAPVPPETTSFPTQPVVGTPPTIQIARRRSSTLWLNVVLVLAALVATGGVAFAVGRNTAPVAAAAGRGNGTFAGGNFPRGSFAPGQSGAPDFGNGGGFAGGLRGAGGAGFNLSGTVQSVTGDTLTITTATGQTLEFSLGSGTTYATKTPTTASDIKAGSNVEVQLNFGAGGRPSASAAPSGPIGTATTVTVVP